MLGAGTKFQSSLSQPQHKGSNSVSRMTSEFVGNTCPQLQAGKALEAPHCPGSKGCMSGLTMELINAPLNCEAGPGCDPLELTSELSARLS